MKRTSRQARIQRVRDGGNRVLKLQKGSPWSKFPEKFILGKFGSGRYPAQEIFKDILSRNRCKIWLFCLLFV